MITQPIISGITGDAVRAPGQSRSRPEAVPLPLEYEPDELIEYEADEILEY